MSADQIKLHQKLWDIANELRGNMDAGEFKNYILGFIFYKFLSEKVETTINRELESDGITFLEAYNNAEYKDDIIEESIESLGYFIDPAHLFHNIAFCRGKSWKACFQSPSSLFLLIMVLCRGRSSPRRYF